ncbi:MAG: hypothetical protein E7301_07395 [Butyrivibrio sp.]|nr:hypothetical protein [Butyrivibrio sp.]
MMHKLFRRLSYIFFVPFTLLSFVILVCSFLTTVYYDTDQGADLPRFGSQNYIALFAGILIFFALAYYLRSFKPGKRAYIVFFLEILFCLVIVMTARAKAVTDGLLLDNIINDFNKGIYDSLYKGGYLYIYPFQIGYVSIGQLIGRLFGDSNYFVYQIINLLSIGLCVVYLYKLTGELFEDERVCNIYLILSVMMFFLFSYSTYVYNDVWSFAPGIMALYYEVMYLKKKHIRFGIYAGVYLGLACYLKTNLYIALIAMVILLVVDVLNDMLLVAEADKKERDNRKSYVSALLIIILLFAAALIPLKAAGNIYAKKAGLESYPQGVPKSTYFAMAMQEGEGEWGWYNGYNRNSYEENDYDYEKTDEAAKTAISERIAEFKARPLHMCRFYLRKFLSQWADPTFVSIRNFELSLRHSDTKSHFARSIVYGVWAKIFQMIMDIQHFLIYLGVVIYSISTIKNKRFTLPQALLILFVFGGMLFHQIWEGSSRYIIRYYLCLMPFGAYGISIILYRLESIISQRQQRNYR